MLTRKRTPLTGNDRESFIEKNGRKCNACGTGGLFTSKEDILNHLKGLGEYFLILKSGKEVWRFRDSEWAENFISRHLAHIDHVIPFSKGGECSLENYQLLCQSCNLLKSDKPLDVFLNELNAYHSHSQEVC